MTTAPQQGATRSRRLSSTNSVLVLLCLMYAITYIDRVNVSTAAPALASIISPLVAGYVIDKTGNWELPFLGSIGLPLIGSVLAFSMKPGEGLADGSFTPAEQVAV